MTIQDLKNGKKFKFDATIYKLEQIREDNWIISRADFFDSYVASVKTIGRKRITCFTYVLGKRVDVVVNIDKCEEVAE